MGTNYGAVVIGRNEGARLTRCLETLSTADVVVYVDSGSTDHSVCEARQRGFDAVELDTTIPFTAARARNVGFHRLRELAPELAYVQFIDGDCELDATWPQAALNFLSSRANAAVVYGRRREQHPDKTIYNWLCDQEWNGPSGEVLSCGGDAMMRVTAFESVSGYRNELIAGEEPELCARLRQAGWQIWRLDNEMTRHDAAMTHFRQWWLRAMRGGYAYAHASYIHANSIQPLWKWETRRAWLIGFWIPVFCLALGLLFGPWGWASFLFYPAHFLQKALRGKGRYADKAVLAFFYVLVLFPQALGQLQFLTDRLTGLRTPIIEYK